MAFFKLQYILCIHSLFILETFSYGNVHSAKTNAAEGRLFLTPLIENGKIEEARIKARVHNEEMFNTQSYSGYFTINKQYNSNTFFWFFPAQKNPKSAPLILWLQGGPGSTSLFGLFIENGPFFVTKNITLQLREYSWNFRHNVLYIDNPIGTGYSFTDYVEGYATNSEQIGLDLYVALTQFFQLFPELQTNDFYVTGESFGGKYVPALSYVIHEKNPLAKVKINLKGIAIGNGLTDPIHQSNYGDYLYQIGIIDSNVREKFHAFERVYRSLIEQKEYYEALKVLDRMMIGAASDEPSLFFNATGFKYYYNYLFTENSAEADWLEKWLNKDDIKKAIHVGNSSFQHLNNIVPIYLRNDLTRSQADKVAILMQYYRVLIYNGQLDIIVAYPLTVNYLRNLKWPGAEKYKKADRKIWTVDGEIAGYTKNTDKLTEVLVRNAGHMAPKDQPKWMFELITRFTQGDTFN